MASSCLPRPEASWRCTTLREKEQSQVGGHKDTRREVKKRDEKYIFKKYFFEGPWNVASADDQDYSYHWVEFKDVDGDGLEDAFAARGVWMRGQSCQLF